jgi:uncharacterized protein DUF2171
LTEDVGAPVSWFVIEPGWKVVAADGSDVGVVEETVGDSTHDIFDGLTIRTGILGGKRYVPAEQIDGITEGRIQLKLSADQAKYLRPYEEPGPAERITSEGGSWWTRLLDSFRRPRA